MGKTGTGPAERIDGIIEPKKEMLYAAIIT